MAVAGVLGLTCYGSGSGSGSSSSSSSPPRASRSRSRSRGRRRGDIWDDGARCEDRLEAFCAFRERLDSRARAHGSCACGLAGEGSDVDVLTRRPLAELLRDVRDGGSGFTLVEHICAAKVPRLVLRHRATGADVDAVHRASDPRARAKDRMLRAWLRLSPHVRGFALLVAAWARRQRSELPRLDGYPSSYHFLLVALWYLANCLRAVESTSPDGLPQGSLAEDALASVGALGESTSNGQQGPGNVPERLFRGWLAFLAGDAAGRRVSFDLRSPHPGGPAAQPPAGCAWAVVEPIPGVVACRLLEEQVARVADAARWALNSGVSTM